MAVQSIGTYDFPSRSRQELYGDDQLVHLWFQENMWFCAAACFRAPKAMTWGDFWTGLAPLDRVQTPARILDVQRSHGDEGTQQAREQHVSRAVKHRLRRDRALRLSSARVDWGEGFCRQPRLV